MIFHSYHSEYEEIGEFLKFSCVTHIVCDINWFGMAFNVADPPRGVYMGREKV